MPTDRYLNTLLLIIAGLVALSLFSPRRWIAHAAQPIEYKVIVAGGEGPEIEKNLNAFSHQGWELAWMDRVPGSGPVYAILKKNN